MNHEFILSDRNKQFTAKKQKPPLDSKLYF